MGFLAPQLGSVATIPLARFELGDTVVVSRFGREAKITSRTYTLPIRYEARCLASGGLHPRPKCRRHGASGLRPGRHLL